jgi:anti-sigma B factor antagonist
MAPRKVLVLEGEIDFQLSREVAESLQAIIADKPRMVVVDLTKVTHIDSSGLAALVNGMQNTRQYGGQFCLAAMQENVRAIFETACLDQVFAISPNLGRVLGKKRKRSQFN